jgi:pilus assembly protein Flp/PilA
MLRLWTGFQSRIIREEEGATMVEYALLVALIAIIAIIAVALVGTRVSGVFNKVAATLPA